MSAAPDDIEYDNPSRGTWRRARRCLARVLNWPANGNSAYSPLFCVSLLLGVALIIEIGR
jgi:hypothetical protein